LGIHLNIVVTGKLGPYPRTQYEYAVQVCRIYAALGSSRSTIEKTGQSRMINSLWLAGLVLGRDCYPAGMSLCNGTSNGSVSMDNQVIVGFGSESRV
jgi:hypothetical protein